MSIDISDDYDLSPSLTAEGGAQRAHNYVNWRGKAQKCCAFSFITVYFLIYFTVGSNQDVVVFKSGYLYDERAVGVLGIFPERNSSANNDANGVVSSQIQIRKQHILQTATKLSRVYKAISPNQWCIDGRLKYEQAKRRPMGLCYVKIPRAASSTLVGINVRIARNFGSRQGIPETCIRHDGPAPGFYYRLRDPTLSFLWTFVRNPTERAMSRVASNLAKRQIGVPSPKSNSTTDFLSNYVLEALQNSTDMQFGTISEGRGGFQVQYAMLQLVQANSFWNATEPSKIQHPRHVQRCVKGIVDRYDFIGVVERFDESLVALQLLLGLEASDIIYSSSRMHEKYFGKLVPGREGYFCYPSVNPLILRAPRVETYLSSSTWWAQNYGDFLLHEAASLSLDRTIMEIGLTTFSQALQTFRSMLTIARQTCHPIFPCSDNGTVQIVQAEENCYFEDIGCGYPCFDSLPNGNSTNR